MKQPSLAFRKAAKMEVFKYMCSRFEFHVLKLNRFSLCISRPFLMLNFSFLSGLLCIMF